MPLPNLVKVGNLPQCSIPAGPDHPWEEDLQLATLAGYSSFEVSGDLSERGEQLRDDFHDLETDRIYLREDLEDIKVVLALAGDIAVDYVFGGLRNKLQLWPWEQAPMSRQLVTTDSSGGCLFSQAFYSNSLRASILARYPYGAFPHTCWNHIPLFRGRLTTECKLLRTVQRAARGITCTHMRLKQTSVHPWMRTMSSRLELWMSVLRSRRALGARA